MTTKIVTLRSDTHELALERDGACWRVGEHAIELVGVRGQEAELLVDGARHVVPFVVQGTTVSFAFDGEIYSVDVADKGARGKRKQGEHSMSAPMPGVVLKIFVSPGDVVAKGAPLLILEAMKMEHQIVAPYDGTVKTLNCKEGEMVQPGVDLIEMETDAGESR